MLRRYLLDLEDDWDEDEDIERLQRILRPRSNFEFESDVRYKEHFRLSRVQVDYVHNLIGQLIERRTRRSCALSSKQRLLLSLNWLGSGSQLHIAGTSHGVVKSTVSNIVKEVVNAVITEVFPRLVRWPEENVVQIPRMFQEKGGFSVCRGLC